MLLGHNDTTEFEISPIAVSDQFETSSSAFDFDESSNVETLDIDIKPTEISLQNQQPSVINSSMMVSLVRQPHQYKIESHDIVVTNDDDDDDDDDGEYTFVDPEDIVYVNIDENDIRSASLLRQKKEDDDDIDRTFMTRKVMKILSFLNI